MTTLLEAQIDNITTSKTNPRRRRGPKWQAKIAELAASIKEKGVLEPLLCRPMPGADQADGAEDLLELVAGERRLEGSRLAGLKHVPVLVRDMSDDEALEIQVVENNQREDLHPLDEADGFQALIKRGHPLTYVAQKIGRSPGYVAQRLKLCGLCAEVRKAFDEDKLLPGVALLIARLEDAGLQKQALEQVVPRYDGDGLVQVAEARERIETEVMLELGGAPFDVTSSALVKAAGPCTTCPKRTGNQRELFPDTKSKDLCTDGACFRKKSEATFQIRKKQAEAEGTKILSDAQSKSELSRGGGDKFARLDAEIYVGKFREKKTTVRALFKAAPPPVVLAKDPTTGGPVELVSAAVVEEAKAKLSRDKGGAKAKPTVSAKREREKQLVAVEVLRRSIAQMVAEVESGPLDDQVLAVLVEGAIDSTWHDAHKSIAERRQLPELDGKKKAHVFRGPQAERLRASIVGMSKAKLAGLLLELLIHRAEPTSGAYRGGAAGGRSTWQHACQLFSVNPKTIEAQVVKDRKRAELEKAKKAKGPRHHWMPNNRNACGAPVHTGTGHGASSHFGPSVTCPGCIAVQATPKGQKIHAEQEKATARARAVFDRKLAKKPAKVKR